MSQAAAPPAPPSAAGALTVRVELISWVNQFVDGPGTGSVEFREQLPSGATVRQALQQVARRFPKLREALWDEADREALGPHIEIIVNDAILGIAHDLDSPLHDHDRITLAGQYIGG
jgi:molybdopterin converting factor small subunit